MNDPDLPHSIHLDGASNVRDLGGYAVAGGGRVRRGKVFRGASLSGLTDADGDRLRALGLRTICDLRGEREATNWPSRVDGVRTVKIPIEPTVGASLRDLAATERATGEDAMEVMRRAYVAYVDDCAPQYAALLGHVLADEGPLLFHCSAGKDRTGFGAALLLSLLGVTRVDVLADYMATNRLWRGDSALAAELPPAMGAVLLRVHAPLLAAAFEAIEARGGLMAYASERLGVDDEGLRRLRDIAVDDTAGSLAT